MWSTTANKAMAFSAQIALVIMLQKLHRVGARVVRRTVARFLPSRQNAGPPIPWRHNVGVADRHNMEYRYIDAEEGRGRRVV